MAGTKWVLTRHREIALAGVCTPVYLSRTRLTSTFFHNHGFRRGLCSVDHRTRYRWVSLLN
jgi:hypothetical protein